MKGEPEDALEPRHRGAEIPEGEASSARLLLRFGVGVAEIAGARLAVALRVFDELRAAPATVSVAGSPAVALRHVLLGALTAAPGGLTSASSHTRRLLKSARRVAQPGLRLLARAPGAARLRRSYDAAQARMSAQIARWAEAGRREELAARALAVTALPNLFELAVARAAESPDLQALIQEQSEGLTSSAVEGLRERSMQADGFAEGLARRLTLRGRSPAGER